MAFVVVMVYFSRFGMLYQENLATLNQVSTKIPKSSCRDQQFSAEQQINQVLTALT
jgi:hypothetical protein